MKSFLTWLLFTVTLVSYAQENYYTFQGELYDEEAFNIKLKSIEDIYSKQGTYKYTKANYKVRNIQVHQDSVIQEVEVMLSQSNSSPLDINTGVESFMNKPLPDFTLTNLTSNLRSKESYADKVTLINLWFTSCPPCIAEIPYLNALKEQYEDRVHFVAITFEDKDKINDFLSQKSFDFEHLVEGGTYFNRDLKNKTYPKLIILDKTGTVRFVENSIMGQSTGPRAEVTEILKEQLDYLLAQQ